MNKLEIVGKELLKGNFGNAFAAATTKSIHSELIQPSRYRNGSFFYGVNGADKAFIWGNFNSSLIAYQSCPIVSAVIHKQAQALVNGRQMVMTGKGKTAKEATTTQAVALGKLLKRPNRLQTGKEFRAQASIYKRIYGYCAILKIIPSGFQNDYSAWTLWNIPPWMIQVEDSMGLFWERNQQPFKRITLTYMGQSFDVPLDNPNIQIAFIKENQISTSTFMYTSSAQNVSLFLPDSKLFPLTPNINSFNGSLNTRGSIIMNRGPLFVLSNDSSDTGDAGLFPIDPDTKKELKEDFTQYGAMRGQSKAIITDAKLKLQTVGFDVSQMKLLEGEIQDAKMICDGLNYPPYLLGLVDAKFDNQQIAERALYTNSIIPDAESEDEQWGSQIFGLDAFGLRLETDFSHLPALQENIAEQGRGRWYMNQALLIEWLQDGITWNQWREMLGDDTVAGRDLYYSQMVAQGLIIAPAPTKNPADPAPGAPNVQSDQAQLQLEELIGKHKELLSANGHNDSAAKIDYLINLIKNSAYVARN